MENHAGIEIAWRPCECHPRPERASRYSDRCIQAMYFALDHGVEAFAFHDLMYRGALTDHIDIEDIDVLRAYLSSLVDELALKEALLDNRYAERVKKGNDYAYQTNGIWAVPSYRMAGKKLDSVEGVGVSYDQLKAFLDEHSRGAD